MHQKLWHGDREFRLKIRQNGNERYRIELDDTGHDVEVEPISRDEFVLKIDGRVFDVIVADNCEGHSVYINGKCIPIRNKSVLDLLSGQKADSGQRDVKTSMPGRIVNILVREGAVVEEGQPVLILEAMKMQNEIKSPRPGRIVRIAPRTGESVESGALLFTVE